MVGHKTSLSKFKRIEIISSTSFDCNDMRLEINYKKKNEKPAKNTNTWRLNNMLLKKPMGHYRNQRGIKKYSMETNKNTMIQNLCDKAHKALL